MRLDPLDVAILAALAADARRSLRDVAGRVGSTPTTVSARLERLKEAGIVEGATLRYDPARLPGHSRLLTARLPADQVEDVLALARSLQGVVEAAVTADRRLVVLLHVRDLGQEEEVTAAFAAAGAEEVAVTAARRSSGPPLVHLFTEAGTAEETCAECGRSVGDDPVTETVDGRRVPFCCPSCRKLYLARYGALRAAAGSEGRPEP